MKSTGHRATTRLRAITLLALLALSALGAAQSNGYNIVWDNFKNGFTVNTPTAKWFYFGAGPYVGNNGVTSTSNRGLHVESTPFSLTLGQETDPIDNPYGLPGGLDHVKWLVFANHMATSGYPGFDAIPGQELTVESWISGRSFGNASHPFGSAVVDPDDDIRLATAAMPTIDFETFLVSDFFMTNKRIYALYERLPFGRSPGHNYAAFTYAIPVAERKPFQQQHLAIAYDRSAHSIRWLVDDHEVFRVTQPGHRLPSQQYMILNHGGVDEDVDCRQRDVGLGTFTLLDAAYPTQQALVKLSVDPNFYYSTVPGNPGSQTFVDPLSMHNSRQWGQGATLDVKMVRVSSRIIGP